MLRPRALRSCAIVLVFLSFGCAAPRAWAQTAGAPSAEARLSEQIASRQWTEAWQTLERLPDTPARLRTRVMVALELGRIDDAIASANKLDAPSPGAAAASAASRAAARDALRAIVTAVATPLRSHSDPDVRIAACAGLAQLGDADCRTALRRDAAGTDAAPPARLLAAEALISAGDPDGRALLTSVAEGLAGTQPVHSAAALARVPADRAVPALTGLLASGSKDAQYIAAYTLGNFPTDDARRALRHHLQSSETAGAQKLAATVALARLGDKASLAWVRSMATELGGRDKLEAARALDAAGDPAGAVLMRQVLTGDHDVLRYEAAVLLAARDPDAVRRTLTTGLASENPWTRAAALEAFRRLGWRLPRTGRRLLADPVATVRAATVAALAPSLAAPPPTAPKPTPGDAPQPNDP